VEGGDSRQQSVENALATVSADTELVAVHDAVRPFVEVATIEKVIIEGASDPQQLEAVTTFLKEIEAKSG
jgi:2-C-methyl-D-erythritol 4-phosphate cytidylyltransferase